MTTDILTSAKPVPRELAHRAGTSAYVTSIVRETEARWRLVGIFPDGPLYRAVDPRYHDLLPLAEVMRQAGEVVAHEGLDVPLSGYRFLMNDLALYLTDARGMLVNGPGSLSLSVGTADPIYRSGALYKVRFHVRLWRGDLEFARGSGLLIVLPVDLYDRIQPRPTGAIPEPTAPLPPPAVGRTALDEVLLHEGSTSGWQVRVDIRRTPFFDHWQDHLPGIVQLEVFRQAALATAGPHRTIEGVKGNFLGLIHPDDTFACQAFPGSGSVVVEFSRQDGRVFTTGEVFLSP